MWFWRRQDNDRSRRIRSIGRSGLGVAQPNPYLYLDEWRYGDDWMESRDRLRSVVQTEILSREGSFTFGNVSIFDVWDLIIPSSRPSHWITCGLRFESEPKTQIPIIQIPVSLGTDERAIVVCNAIFFAIEALPLPSNLETNISIPRRDRAVICLTLLSALSIAVRDQMRSDRQR